MALQKTIDDQLTIGVQGAETSSLTYGFGALFDACIYDAGQFSWGPFIKSVQLSPGQMDPGAQLGGATVHCLGPRFPKPRLPGTVCNMVSC